MLDDYTIASAIQMSAVTQLILGLAALGFILIVFSWFAGAINPKSKQARQLVTDLYVIGMVRKFAAADGINLEEEMKGLRRIEKWEKASRRSVDWMVETELNERIAADGEKKVDEIKKSK